MRNKAEALIFIVIFLLIISLGVSGFCFIFYKYEKKTRIEIEGELDSVKVQKEKIEEQLAQINEEKIILEERLKENKRLISELEEKLDKEIQAKELLIAEQQDLEKENLKVKQEHDDIKNNLRIKIQELRVLQNRLNAAVLERNELRSRISELTLSKNNAENLDKIVVKSSDSTGEIKRSKPSLSTVVLSVNLEYGFLVLNVGLSSVELGDVFEVFHRDKSIGRVRVEKIHDTISAADFLDGFDDDRVSEGDIARRMN